MVNGKQLTITWHVDDFKASHVHERVLDEFVEWLKRKFGSDVNKLKVHKGKVHDYLAMNLDYTVKGQVRIDVIKHVKDMTKEFLEQINKAHVTPASVKLFSMHKASNLMRKERIHFITLSWELYFFAKGARLDIQQTITFLCMRVQKPTEEDWYKLIWMMKYLNGKQKYILILKADSLSVVKWYTDAAFAVHQDMKSNSGITMTMGKGAIISSSQKQNLNARSSTKAELVAAADSHTSIMWTKLFLKRQGYNPRVIQEW